MDPTAVAALLLAAAYLAGAVPFGYLVGRLRGVDLFREGSGNIGATNAARVLGRAWGLAVFALDFAKGAIPVAVAVPLARLLAPGAESAFGPPDALRIGAAAAALVGHLFPVFLRFRGGKGVATGLGTIAVLVPGPAALTVLFWVVVLLASRAVSLASLAAAAVLLAARLLGTPDASAPDRLPVTAYLLVGVAAVAVKHRSNVGRLLTGTESRVLPDGEGRRAWLRAFHVVALGTWFGGAGFFNFFAAPAIFESFKRVVDESPSDRTASLDIVPAGADADDRKALANALAGSAVGPVFPLYFGMQAACAGVALATALAWWPGGRVHRLRVWLIAAAALIVAAGWPISLRVGELRIERFDRVRVKAVAEAARPAFVAWHLASLLLSFISLLLAGAALALAALLPIDGNPSSTGEKGPGEPAA